MGNLSLLQGIFPTQGSNPSLPHCRQILHQLSDQGSPGLFVTVQSEITTKAYWLASLESPSVVRTEVPMLYLCLSLLCFSLDYFHCFLGSHPSSQQLQKESLYPYSFIFPVLGLTDLAWVFCASLTNHYGNRDKMLLFVGTGLCVQPSKDPSHINQTNLQYGRGVTSQGNQGAVTKIRKSYWAGKSKYVQISSSQECLYRWKQMFLEEHILTDLEPLWSVDPESSKPCRGTGRKCRGLLMLLCYTQTLRIRYWESRYSQGERNPVMIMPEFPISLVC